MKFDAKIPEGPLTEKWSIHKRSVKLVNPANKTKLDIILVGTGLAGAAAASSLGELGYNVKAFCFQDTPRRAHSVAAQGGINAAKNYRNDGDSVYRLFYDVIKGGDFRAREANVYRAAEVSNQTIDQLVAAGVPFAREYSGVPVIFGPNFNKFHEAVDLIERGGAYNISSKSEFIEVINTLLNNQKKYEASSFAARNYVEQKQGATGIIVNYLKNISNNLTNFEK